MPVVGIDAPQPMLLGAHKVQCICRADRYALAQRADGVGGIHNQGIRNRKSDPQPCRAIVGKLGGNFMELALSKSAFTPLTMKNARHFDTTQRAAMHVSKRFRQTADGITFRLVQVKLGDIRVEIAHAQLTYDRGLRKPPVYYPCLL